uniref:GDSL esterase/lipase n=1 Tax=Salix viminalis TaxID=40686 RepID=A0A6N2L1T2_SALVM
MVPAIFVFGDSLVDVGNNNKLPVSVAKANFPHNGIDFPTKKATGRFSNGKNAADFLAQKVGLPTSPAYLSVSRKSTSSFMTGASFASGGAGIFNGTDRTLGQSIPLTKQVGYYESVYDNLIQQQVLSGAQKSLSKSLFAIVIGSNDILDYSGSLHASGARKFVFAGIGPIGCIPAQRIKNQTDHGCNEGSNLMAVSYNKGLNSMLRELKSNLTAISYSYFDTYSLLLNIIQNPATYGFAEAEAACCGRGKLNAQIPCLPVAKYCPSRRDHVFWDLYHPTEATAAILVDAIFDGPKQYAFPMNVRQLVTV